MKKLLTVFLTLALLLTAFCFAEGADFSGEWHLATVVYEGFEIAASDMGMSMTVALNGDGSAVVTTNAVQEEINDGTWEMKDGKVVLTIEGTPMDMTPEGEYLVMISEEDAIMNFSREKAEEVEAGTPVGSPEFTIPATVAADSLAAFDGTWNVTVLDLYGTYYTLDMLGDDLSDIFASTDPSIVIDNGIATLFGIEDAIQFNLEDGGLVGEDGDTIALCEGDMIAYTTLGAVFYCTKAA